jgi:hypothetical protein
MLLEWIVENNINCSQLARSQLWCQKENTIIFYNIKFKKQKQNAKSSRNDFFLFEVHYKTMQWMQKWRKFIELKEKFRTRHKKEIIKFEKKKILEFEITNTF